MSKFTKFVFASDVHGDMQDEAANEALFRFVDSFKPEIRIMGGDLWDFRPLRKGACDDEKRESLAKDYNAGMQWLKRFKPQFFLLGNHDARLFELAEADKGVASDYAAQGVAEIRAVASKLKCKVLPYHHRDGLLKIGRAKFAHGFSTGLYAARVMANTYGAVIFGHVHTVSEFSIPGLERRVARSVGCLCKLSMEYQIRQLQSLAHSHGFAYGIINERTGSYVVNQAEEIDGKWILPSDFKIV